MEQQSFFKVWIEASCIAMDEGLAVIPRHSAAPRELNSAFYLQEDGFDSLRGKRAAVERIRATQW